MKFYEKYYANNYDELITYYPRFYRNVFEMVGILKTHGRILDGMEVDIEQAYLNGFIDYADEAAISKLEVFLGISIGGNRTLWERRRLVKSYFVGSGKISASKIYQMIAVYTGSPAICKLEPFDDVGNNRLYVEVQSNEEETICIKDIFTLLSKKIPANLVFCFASRLMVEIPVPVDIQAGLRMVSSFYPRYNTPLFYLDGSVMLDGTYHLNGYLSGEALDFYPVMLWMVAGAYWRTGTAGTVGARQLFRPEVQVDVRDGAALGIWGAVRAEVRGISRLFLQGNALAGTRTGSQLTVQGAAAGSMDAGAITQAIVGAEMGMTQNAALQMRSVADCGVGTDGALVVEKDLWRLDGSVMLDGSHILDAEIYTEEI